MSKRATRLQILTARLMAQTKWMRECGGDLPGYINNYCYQHGRTEENAAAIYAADLAELRKAEALLAEVN